MRQIFPNVHGNLGCDNILQRFDGKWVLSEPGPQGSDITPEDEDWRRYLAGDRAVFARRIAGAIDEDAIARIATLNRENTRFRDAANATDFKTSLLCMIFSFIERQRGE